MKKKKKESDTNRTLRSSPGRDQMDNIVDSLNKAYEKFVLASAGVLESKESAGGQKALLTDTALENFKEKWELFRVACDQAEEFVESVKQRIGSECLVDEATGLTTTAAGGQAPAAVTGAATSLPPISAVRLEQMSRAVRWLVLELQRGSGVAPGSVHSSSTGYMDSNQSMRLLSAWIGQIGDLGLNLLWRFIHIVVSLWYIVSGIFEAIESYAITLGLNKKYGSIDLEKLRCLAVVVDIEAAQDVANVVELLQWLTTIGVKQVGLFDSQGLLKKSKDLILETVPGSMLLEEIEKDVAPDGKRIALEFISSSDNKEAVMKAANILLQRYLKSSHPEDDKGEDFFTESHLNDALRVVGENVHVPDLLLVYGPIRSHLGFPAWRLRYTEIVHMGTLKYMRYGSLLKAIHKFTGVHQNYGT
ncbi:F25C20.9 [Arabidopsis thaliana]|nr:F25C20.9 [Arabidopsis thaliana]